MTFFSITKKIAIWYVDHTVGTVVALLSISALVASAATSYDVSNAPQMYLDSSITSTQTTGIVLSAPVINGSYWTYTTTTGAVLRIRSGTYREDIYYATASVNSSTYKVTLSGVTRDLCPDTITFTSCGNGRRWGKGAIVELIQDQRLFDLKANVDRVNTFGTGAALRGTSTTIPLFRLNSVTTTQKNAMSAGNGDVVYDSTIGANFQYVSGAWSQIGDTGTSNATTSAAGKVQLASTGSMVSRNVTGSSGAAEVVQTQYLTGTGGITRRWNIPLLGRMGTLTGSLLGLNSSQGSGTGKFLGENGRFVTLTRTDLLNAPAGSGAGLDINSSSGGALTTSTVGGAFTDVNSDLVKTITVETGSLIFTTFKTGVAGDSTGGKVFFDIRVGGGRLGTIDGGTQGHSGGLLNFSIANPVNINAIYPVNLSHMHKVQTGGILTISPQWRTNGNASNWARIWEATPTYFQVSVFKGM